MTPTRKIPPNPYYIFYHHFGLHLKSRGDEWVTTCPFCGKDDHFAIRQKDGLYNCLRCSHSGNTWVFIQDLHKHSLISTSDGDYAALSQNRGLLVSTLRQGQLAKSILQDAWLIPSFNQEGKLVNLYQAIPHVQKTTHVQTTPPLLPPSRPVPPRKPPRNQSSGSPSRKFPLPPTARKGGAPGIGNNQRIRYELRSAPSPCSQQLYGIELIRKQSHFIICEGHWDRLAMWEIFAHFHLKHDAPIKSVFGEDYAVKGTPEYESRLFDQLCILGVPGANIFKSDWTKLLRGKHVTLVYDNDPDRVICPTCRGKDDYRAHLAGSLCPLCHGSQNTGEIINPGKSGIEKVLKELDELGITPESLHKIEWKQSDPKDIRDLLLA